MGVLVFCWCEKSLCSRQLTEEFCWVYHCRGLDSMMVECRQKVWGTVIGTATWELISWTSAMNQGKQDSKMAWVFKLSEPTFRGELPLTRLHLLNLFKNTVIWGPSVPMTRLWEHLVQTTTAGFILVFLLYLSFSGSKKCGFHYLQYICLSISLKRYFYVLASGQCEFNFIWEKILYRNKDLSCCADYINSST